MVRPSTTARGCPGAQAPPVRLLDRAVILSLTHPRHGLELDVFETEAEAVLAEIFRLTLRYACRCHWAGRPIHLSDDRRVLVLGNGSWIALRAIPPCRR